MSNWYITYETSAISLTIGILPVGYEEMSCIPSCHTHFLLTISNSQVLLKCNRIGLFPIPYWQSYISIVLCFPEPRGSTMSFGLRVNLLYI